jgi:hypothetical protein
MMKKLFLILLTFFAAVQAQDTDQDDLDFAFQELVYDMGISLARQNLIIDMPTAKNALLNVYQDVTQVMQIVDLFMIIDEEIVEQNITTIDALIDFEINGKQAIAQTGIAWLSAYQNLFIVFTSLHPEDSSFEVWCDDMAFFASLEDGQEPVEPAYLELWQASCAILDVQEAFEYALKNIE